MKNKLYRIISPVTLLIVLALDAATVAYAVFAVKKLIQNVSVYSVLFAIIDLFAIVVAVLVSKYVVSQGIVFGDKTFEFTALDENNVFNYDDVENIKIHKDTRMNNMFDKNELEEEVPLGRLGTSEEVADAIFYLTQNKYITAQILGVNGGII